MGVVVRQKGKHWYIFMSLLITFHSTIINSYAGSLKEEYELQEKCAKSAATAFKRYYGEKCLLTRYTNHYNRKLNKCFIMVNETGLPKKKGDRPYEFVVLVDVNENKEYASLFMFSDDNTIMECKLLGEPVSSKAEWDKIVKQYMEE